MSDTPKPDACDCEALTDVVLEQIDLVEQLGDRVVSMSRKIVALHGLCSDLWSALVERTVAEDQSLMDELEPRWNALIDAVGVPDGE